MKSLGDSRKMLDVSYNRIGIAFTEVAPSPMAKSYTPPWCYAELSKHMGMKPPARLGQSLRRMVASRIPPSELV